jgi:uncharacterized membrane-anchored protein
MNLFDMQFSSDQALATALAREIIGPDSPGAWISRTHKHFSSSNLAKNARIMSEVHSGTPFPDMMRLYDETVRPRDVVAEYRAIDGLVEYTKPARQPAVENLNSELELHQHVRKLASNYLPDSIA